MILDVGCGGRPRGHVNIDLYHGESPHTVKPIDPRSIENFIIADAHRLPLRSDSFSLVICDHVLEHLERPWEALAEFRRVAEGLLIRVPNAPLEERREHLYTWTRDSFHSLLSRFYSSVRIAYRNRLRMGYSRLYGYPLIGHILRALFPIELEAWCRR